jgi:hypothetical protein
MEDGIFEDRFRRRKSGGRKSSVSLVYKKIIGV